MNLTFRACSEEYKEIHHIISGIGAKQSGGRWNLKGTPAVYTALSPETAVHEKVYYMLYQKKHFSNNHLGSLAEECLSYYEVEIKVANKMDVTDLTNISNINLLAKESGLEPIENIIETQMNSPGFNNRFTAKIGSKLLKDGQDAFKVKSARHNNGECIIINPIFLKTADIEIVEEKQVFLYFDDGKGKPILGKGNPVIKNIFHSSYDNVNFKKISLTLNN